jgi:hypothetical protein
MFEWNKFIGFLSATKYFSMKKDLFNTAKNRKGQGFERNQQY